MGTGMEFSQTVVFLALAIFQELRLMLCCGRRQDDPIR
jgi:hypothetical protein